MTQAKIVTLGWRQERVKATGRWTPTFQRQMHSVKLCWLMKLLELLLQVRTSPTTVNHQLRLEWKVVRGTRADSAKLRCFDPCQLDIWVFDESRSPIGISSSCCWSQNITCSDFIYPGIAQEVEYLLNQWSCLEVLHPALANCLVHVFGWFASWFYSFVCSLTLQIISHDSPKLDLQQLGSD